MKRHSLNFLLLATISSLLACASRTPAPGTGHPPAPAPASAPPQQVETTQPEFLHNMHQLTFAGARAGEGYFSADGRWMVFQSEREKNNPFYQIYLMSMKDHSVRRISPGAGKTSCAWINPDGKHILFASTHADPNLKVKAEQELERRKAPNSRYSWNFDESFDIYQSDMHGGHLKNLTHSLGYDAEGSYSPDGQWIAFASNRAGHSESLSAEQKKIFSEDPSYLMDIYLMRADGSQVRRLTTSPGYDGGPFFSPDGKRLTWRHFSVDGKTAEVFTMNVDGSDQKQITHLGKMSWAPFYHPSGDYLIFASNQFGHQNFELFIVDTLGTHAPARVTTLDGFDGLPVFTPNGRELIWTHSPEGGEAQLYQAEWNDALARSSLGLAPVRPDMRGMAPGLNTRATKAWINYLASATMDGRKTGSASEREYLDTVAKAFRDSGLEPINKTYFHKYAFASGVDLGPNNHLSLRTGKEITTFGADDWLPLSFSKTGHFEEAGLTFAGYGIVAPADGAQPEYNSYGSLDVKDKWVVAFAGLPEEVNDARRFHLHRYSQLRNKAMAARERGARGLVIVSDGVSPGAPLKLTFDGRGEDVSLPVLRLADGAADRLFTAGKTGRSAWAKRLSRGSAENFAWDQSTLVADVDLQTHEGEAANAVGLLRVPGATSTLVIGAHGDHLGRGDQGSSLGRGEPGRVHPGADDNASGVAGVLELARDLGRRVKAHDLKLRQNILFAVWTGEEIGILGSSSFVKEKPAARISAYLNMDMIGRYRDQLMVQGVGSSPNWRHWIEQVKTSEPLTLHLVDDPYLPTDSLSFYLHQIPTLSFFTGSHPEYHTPEDRPETINHEGVVRTLGWIESLAIHLAENGAPDLPYRKVEHATAPSEGHGRGLRLFLGTIPDYSSEGSAGVEIAGTSHNSPAERAGVMAGDRIIELGGIKIKNLTDYTYCLKALKANQPIGLKLVRGNEEKTLQVTPELRAR